MRNGILSRNWYHHEDHKNNSVFLFDINDKSCNNWAIIINKLEDNKTYKIGIYHQNIIIEKTKVFKSFIAARYYAFNIFCKQFVHVNELDAQSSYAYTKYDNRVSTIIKCMERHLDAKELISYAA